MKFEIKDPLFLPHCACDVQFDLDAFEGLVLVGENGIGKTTLLHHLSLTLNSDLWSLVDQKSLDYFFDRQLGSLKHIFLHSELRLLNPQRFEELWNAFGLIHKEERLLSELSGGEGQALKLCLTLSKDVGFYFLDEPTHYLDLNRKRFLMSYLEKLRQSGKAILMVEHGLSELPKGWRVLPLELNGGQLTKGSEWTI